MTTAESLARDGSHRARTVRSIRAAFAEVPFYAKQGISPPDEDADLDETLRRLPLLTRDRIRPTLPKMWLPAGRDARQELASGKLSIVEVGGGHARARVLFDAAWYREQEAQALAIHPSSGRARTRASCYREAVLWVPERGVGSCGAGDPAYEDRVDGARLHLNSRQDPTFWSDVVMTRMLDELARHRAVGLLSDPFYLDVLARHAAESGRKLPVSDFVALTRARATRAHRLTIDEVFGGAVFDVFAARETGTLFVEGDDALLHHVPRTTHVELLPAAVLAPGCENLALVVVTTLDRQAQPLVRYALEDLVQVANAPSQFTSVPPLHSVEGRFEDALVRPDGALVTAGAVDRALAPLAPRAYQATQREPTTIEIDVVAGDLHAVRGALADLLAGVRLEVRAATAIAAEPDGKYRSCRRLTPLSLAACFEGAS